MTADFPSDDERNDETRDTASDDAFARLEKEMAAMKNANGSLPDQVADAARDIGAAAQDQAEQGLKYTRRYAGASGDSVVAGASDLARAAAKAAQRQVSPLGDTLDDTIRERPLSTIALALGLGFLLGLTLRR
jgi:ElaB/YqjD/DUF883 family membrane-anchored ribosome-binding protein